MTEDLLTDVLRVSRLDNGLRVHLHGDANAVLGAFAAAIDFYARQSDLTVDEAIELMLKVINDPEAIQFVGLAKNN